MAFTITKKLPNQQIDAIGGFLYATVADCQFDSSYASSGESLTAADLGFPTSHSIVHLNAHPTGGLIFEYDYSAKKLKAFYPTGGATTPGAGSILTPIVTTGASTASAVDATTPNITPGKGKEVANTTDLSTITVRVFAVAAAI